MLPQARWFFWRGKATESYLTLYEAMRDFVECSEIVVHWYKLEETGRSIGTFQVHTVPIVPLEGVDGGKKFWPPPHGRRAPMHRPQQGAPTGSNDVEEPGVAPGEDDCDPDEGVVDEPEADDLGEPDEALGLMLDEVVHDAEKELALKWAEEETQRATRVDLEGGAPSRVAEEPGSSSGGAAGGLVDPEGQNRTRSSATITFHVPGGSISYYPKKNAFEAVCANKDHGRCVLTRTSRAKRDSTGLANKGGRPVGWMAAWLGLSESLPDKASHWSADALRRPLSERAGLRERIESVQSGRVLLGCERPVVEGESPEPETLDDYIPASARAP